MPLVQVNTFIFSVDTSLADIARSGWSQQQLRDIDLCRRTRVGWMELATQPDVGSLFLLHGSLNLTAVTDIPR